MNIRKVEDPKEDAKRWEILNSAKVGDTIVIKTGAKPRSVIFEGMVRNGRKYIWRGRKVTGTVYRYPLSVIVARQKTPTLVAEMNAD